SIPLEPLPPACVPPLLKSGHGGPPITPKMLGRGPENACLRTFLDVKSQILFVLEISAVTLLFLFNEDDHDDIPHSYPVIKAGLFSLVQQTENPACLKPRSKKPPPVKNEMTGIAI